MGKVILLVLLVIVAFLILKSVKRSASPGERTRGAAAPKSPERMLTCAWCGVNLPETEGVRAGEKFFCSEGHRRLGS